MSYVCGEYKIIRKCILPGYRLDITLYCPDIAALAVPGQFVHIRIPGHTLRRPISIAEIGRSTGELRIIFEIRGEGTKWLASCSKGDLLNLLGPLGNGFSILSPDKKAIVIGGGIGIPPLLEVAKCYRENADVLLGFRNKQTAFLIGEFQDFGCNTAISSDDGSIGRRGFVSNLLIDFLNKKTPDIIYACGPTAMLKSIAQIAGEYHIRCQVSMEERMGCGVGACLVCACKVKRKNGSETYKHVCKDGPVFEGSEVVF